MLDPPPAMTSARFHYPTESSVSDPYLETLSRTDAVALFPAASRAVAVNVEFFVVALVESHTSEYGAAVTSGPIAMPSTAHWTPMTATLSCAMQVKVVSPLGTTPDGDVIAMVGATVSTAETGAGMIASDVEADVFPTVAPMCAVVVTDTDTVVTWKVAVLEPAGILTAGGTDAKFESVVSATLVADETVAFSETKPVAVFPPTREDESSDSAATVVDCAPANSNAPTSYPAPAGRAVPSKSVVTAGTTAPVSTAGLPEAR